jgi:hypothetical protein
MRKSLRVLLVAGLLAAALPLAAPAANADHDHVLLLGNGKCVVLAAEGNEKYVQLPYAGEYDENRQHPLHVNVHLGQPGERDGEPVIWVKGSPGDEANCDGYVNP